jgi:DNase/tRNase domain of colicin-like bacteriocin/Possible hemagglutinin (DUF637)
MFKKFISCLILVSYVHQILAFTVLRASEGEIDFVIKVKNKFGAINLKVRDKDKNKIVNINLEDCLASDTEEKDSIGDNLSGGGSTVDLKDQNSKTVSDNYGLSNLSSIYDDERQGIGWLWDLSKYNLPKLVVGLDGSVLVDKFRSYQNQKIKLKATEISLNNCRSEYLKLKAPKINLYGTNRIKDLDIKGFSCHLAKDGLITSEKLNIESSLINDGKIDANLVVKGFEVSNNGTIGLANSFFEVNSFENSGSIESIKTSILVKENFNNTGLLKTITSFELVSLNNLKLGGKIKSRDLKIISEVDVINKSFLEANQVTIKALNLDNHQDVKANQTLDLDLKKSLVNQKTGQIKSDNLVLGNEDLEIINHGDGIETESNDESKAKVNGEIVIGKLPSNTKIKHIKNYGFLEIGQGELQLKTFDNYGQSVMGKGDWHLGDFHNFDNAILDLGEHTITKTLINDGYLRSKTKLNINGNFANGMGKIISQGKVVWDMTSDTKAGEVLAKSVFMAPHLTINHENFVNDKKLVFNSPVVINAKKFSNFGEIKAKDLEIFGDDFINGQSNDVMGLLASKLLKINIKNNLDNKFGKIFSSKDTNIKANNVFIGAVAYLSTVHKDEGNIVAHYFKGCRQNWYIDPFYNKHVMNGAYLACNKDLTIESGNEILVDFGEIFSGGNLCLKGKNLIKNISGAIRSQGNLSFYGKKFVNTRPDLGRYSANGIRPDLYSNVLYHVECADAAQVNVLQDIYFYLEQVANEYSDISAGGSIFKDKTLLVNSYTPYKEQAGFSSYGRVQYDTEYFNGSYLKIEGRMPTTTASIKAGDSIVIKGSDAVLLVNNNLNAVTVDIDVKSLVSKITSKRSETNTEHHLIIDLSQVAKMNILGGFFKELADGGIKADQILDEDLEINNMLSNVAVVGETDHDVASVSNIDQASLVFAIHTALSKCANHLNFEGNTGNELINYLGNNSIVEGKKKFKNIEDFVSHIEKPALFSLWQEANGILQKVQSLVVPRNFINPYQSHGDISGNNIKMITSGDQSHESDRVYAEKDLFAFSGGQMIRKTEKTRDMIDYGFQENILGQQQFISGGNLTSLSKGNNQETGVLNYSGQDMVRGSLEGDFTVQNQTLIRQTNYVTKNRSEFRETTSFLSNTSLAEGNSSLIGNNIKLTGALENSKEDLEFNSKKDISINGAVGYNTIRIHEVNKKSGWFSNKTTHTHINNVVPVFLQSQIKAKNVIFKGGKGVVNGTKLEAEIVRDKTKDGLTVGINTGMAQSDVSITTKQMFSKTRNWSNSKQEMQLKSDLTGVDQFIVEPNENPLKKLTLINVDNFDVKKIEGKYQEITRAMYSESTSGSRTSGLGSSKILPVFALAISLACQQYQFGASFLSSLGASGTVLKMGIAGLSVLTTQAATNFIQTGDPVQVFKNLASDRSLRQVAISVATAGVMDKVGLSNIDGSQSFIDHLKSNAIQGTLSTGINLGISKEEPKDTLKQGCLNIAANTICGYGASKIGANLGDNPIVQTITHFVSGGTAGYILNQSSKGFMSGAIGASVAKMTMRALEGLADAKEHELYAKASSDGKPLTKEKIDGIRSGVREALEKHLITAQITGATIATMFNLDPNIASYTGGITGRNNCFIAVDRSILEKYSSEEVVAQFIAEREMKKRELIEKEKADEQALKVYLEQAHQEYFQEVVAIWKSTHKSEPDAKTLEWLKQSADEGFTKKWMLICKAYGIQQGYLSLVPGLRSVVDGLQNSESFKTIASNVGEEFFYYGAGLACLGSAAKAIKCIKKAGVGRYDTLNKIPYDPRSMENLLHKNYGMENVNSSTLPKTYMPNVKLAGKEIKIPDTNMVIPFDQRGFPVFDKYVVFETKIPEDIFKTTEHIHKTTATRNLAGAINKGQIHKGNFNHEQLMAIFSEKAQIPDYTWHHHQDLGRMQLISRNIHDKVKHIGGNSIWGNK